jgi:hypothetical protein
MPIFASPRYRRIFTQLQSGGLRIINNTSGTWTNTGINFIRASENAVKLSPVMPKTPVPILTGTRSSQPDILGRKSANWELNNVPIIPNGAAGVVPDTDHLWQNAFGGTATIVAATSATYNFSDTGYLPLTILDFMHSQPTLTSRLVFGAFTEEIDITFNSPILQANFRGSGVYRLDSNNFTNEDTTGKGGLTAYPTEPTAPAVNGLVIPGFYGTATFDGTDIACKIRSFTLKIQTGLTLLGEVLCDAYPIAVVGAQRQVSLTLGAIDDDSAILGTLKSKAKQNIPINATVIIGQTAGAQFGATVKTVQLVTEDYDDQSTIVLANFPESRAHASSIGATDDCTVFFQ